MSGGSGGGLPDAPLARRGVSFCSDLSSLPSSDKKRVWPHPNFRKDGVSWGPRSLETPGKMERKTDQFGNVYWQCVKCDWASPPLPPDEQQETPPAHQCTGHKRDTWF
jgi:hypothetical protein